MSLAPDRDLTRLGLGLTAGLAGAGLCVLALVLLLGGGAPQPAPVGLPDAGPLVEWPLVLLPYVANLSAVTVVGHALLGGGFLGVAKRQAPHIEAFRIAVVAAVVWAVASLLSVGLMALQLWAVAGNLDALPESAQVQALLLQAAGAATVAATAWARLRLTLPLALLTLLPDLLAGHARTADSPALAAVAIGAHVAAAALWVGGLVAVGWLALRHRESWAAVLGRYSTLALVCVVALTLSGVVAALGRIDSFGDLLGSGYGAVVLLKSAVLAALVACGALQRRYVVGRGVRANGRDVLLLAGSEVALMTLVIALATGLAQTPPPA